MRNVEYINVYASICLRGMSVNEFTVFSLSPTNRLSLTSEFEETKVWCISVYLQACWGVIFILILCDPFSPLYLSLSAIALWSLPFAMPRGAVAGEEQDSLALHPK